MFSGVDDFARRVGLHQNFAQRHERHIDGEGSRERQVDHVAMAEYFGRKQPVENKDYHESKHRKGGNADDFVRALHRSDSKVAGWGAWWGVPLIYRHAVAGKWARLRPAR